MLKNIEKSLVVNLKDQVGYLPGQVSSKTLSQNNNVSITLFSFDKNEEISTHESKGDAMVTILDGKARIVISDKEYYLEEGESIVMPANQPHSLHAIEQFKMILTVVFPK